MQQSIYDHPLPKLPLIASVGAALAGLGWLGLHKQPQPFAPVKQPRGLSETIALPSGLPAPVERFYWQLYGERVPLIRSAVLSGRATLRLGGLTWPARFRFIHAAGVGYRHYIEVNVLGMPLMQVNEHFLAGKARLDLPFGTSSGPQVDQGANLALWAEAIWFPALWVTDQRVRWEPIDASAATLVVPFGSEQEYLLARFDAETGLLSTLESLRYKEATSAHKTLWLNEARDWRLLQGHLLPATGAVTWFDAGRPWALFTVEDVAYNADVSASIAASGP